MKIRPILLALLMVALAAASLVAMTVMPPAGANLERPARHVDAIWPCAYFKPHSGDSNPFVHDWNNESNPYVDTADCAVDHPTGGQHLYCVVEWHHDGAGNPINPPGYTWQSGWC